MPAQLGAFPSVGERELEDDILVGIVVLGEGNFHGHAGEEFAAFRFRVRRGDRDLGNSAVSYGADGVDKQVLDLELPVLDDRAGAFPLQRVAILLRGEEGTDRAVLLLPLEGLVEVIAILVAAFREPGGDHPAHVALDKHTSAPLAALDLEELRTADRGDRPDVSVVRRVIREAAARLQEDRVVESIEGLDRFDVSGLDGASGERRRPSVTQVLAQDAESGAGSTGHASILPQRGDRRACLTGGRRSPRRRRCESRSDGQSARRARGDRHHVVLRMRTALWRRFGDRAQRGARG